jgi:hypothetical protein
MMEIIEVKHPGRFGLQRRRSEVLRDSDLEFISSVDVAVGGRIPLL